MPVACALAQRGHRGQRGVLTGDVVAVGDVRATPRVGQRGEAGDVLAVREIRGAWAAPAVARDRREHDTGVELEHGVESAAPSVEHTDAEVLDDDVDAREQPPEECAAVVAAHLDRQVPNAAVERCVEQGVRDAARLGGGGPEGVRRSAEDLGPAPGLDLDDVGAELAEERAHGGAGGECAEGEDPHAGERTAVRPRGPRPARGFAAQPGVWSSRRRLWHGPEPVGATPARP